MDSIENLLFQLLKDKLPSWYNSTVQWATLTNLTNQSEFTKL